jgi:hypothetical protein
VKQHDLTRAPIRRRLWPNRLVFHAAASLTSSYLDRTLDPFPDTENNDRLDQSTLYRPKQHLKLTSQSDSAADQAPLRIIVSSIARFIALALSGLEKRGGSGLSYVFEIAPISDKIPYEGWVAMNNVNG